MEEFYQNEKLRSYWRIQVQKILISLADGFTEECEEMAADNRVELINGVGFAQIYFKSI
jgi:hypothetical protein